jgi:pimeloyl-ACP methyl ester carboxylesterase
MHVAAVSAGLVVAGLVAGCVVYVALASLMLFARRLSFVQLMRAALAELGACFMLLPAWPLFWLIGRRYTGRNDATPVVLLHGLGMNCTNWLWLGRSLGRRGAGPLYAMNYFSLQSIERSARRLADFVDKIGASRVHIVAHSMGGLVARHYIERMHGAARVQSLVTIGTPHRGTRLGNLGVWPGPRQLSPDSDFFGGLAGAPDRVRYLSVWSRADALIVPAEAASIDAEHDAVFDDLGHLSMLTSNRVRDIIVSSIT